MDILIKIGVGLFATVAITAMVSEVFSHGLPFGNEKWKIGVVVGILVFTALALLEWYGPQFLLP